MIPKQNLTEQRQLAQLLDDLVSLGLEPWWTLIGPALAEYEMPRQGDHTQEATSRRVKLLRTIVEKAERAGF
jgi:hypothetical protein